jgi:uncharacterized protein YggT (Ycf19 family)
MKYGLGRFILFLITVYTLMLVLRVLLSWIKIPQYRWIYWLCRATDPVIDFFRKNFPIRFGLYDISIVIPIMILFVIRIFVEDFMIGDLPNGTILNIWYILRTLAIIIKSIFNIIIVLYIIFTLILLIFKLISPNLQNPYARNPAIDSIYSLLNPVLKIADNIFKIKSSNSETLYLVIILIFFILINIIGSFLFDNLIALMQLNLNEYFKNFK